MVRAEIEHGHPRLKKALDKIELDRLKDTLTNGPTNVVVPGKPPSAER
jgi:hypothetical protein